MVGRIPDLTGSRDPRYLVRLLGSAAKAKSSAAPGDAFALSAKVWEKSTRMSIRRLLGTTPDVLTSPAKGPKHPATRLAARLHFVNCHGTDLDARFLGESAGGTFPVAMDSEKLAGLVRGSVAAFECCYGAELYPPDSVGAMSIANAYLAAGALGVVASSTIAYGPEDDNANADVVCRVFLERLLTGASLGRAFLEARLALVAGQSVVDPYNAKTLAQFVLLGDPSVHPFVTAVDGAAAGPAPKEAALAARTQRRVRLAKTGETLGRTAAFTVPQAKPDARTKRLERELAKRIDGRFAHVRAFVVKDPAPPSLAPNSAKKASRAQRVFVAVRDAGPEDPAYRLVGLLAYEVGGRLVTQELVSR